MPDIKSGTGFKLYIESTIIRFVKDKTEVALVSASAMTEISCGQDVPSAFRNGGRGRRLHVGLGALIALSKSKKHHCRELIWSNDAIPTGLLS